MRYSTPITARHSRLAASAEMPLRKSLMQPAPTTAPTGYRGRLAPTASGHLHLGHAATFSVAAARATAAGGTLVYRTEDLDPRRCSPQYANAAMEDLRWWGLHWQEGPDLGGPFAPYVQSQRLATYLALIDHLSAARYIYPANCSRAQIAASATRRSPVDGEWIFPAALRPTEPPLTRFDPQLPWRFRVPDGEVIRFVDQNLGPQAFRAGHDFGDFLIWSRDGMPAYELAVVADDIAMQITEVVRGADLLLSTARQLLIYRALGQPPPAWFHTPLIIDPLTGTRLAKSCRSLSLRQLRAAGYPPGQPPQAYASAFLNTANPPSPDQVQT